MPDRAAQIAALSLPLDQLPDPLPIPVIEKPFDVTIRPPGSKSITNRALLLAALADGTSELRGALIDADDAQVMLRAIVQLGAKVEIIRAGEQHGSKGGTGSLSASGVANLDVVRITGVNGRWKIAPGEIVTLNLNNAGTATRFLTAAAMLAPLDSGGIIIDGNARMRERPIAELAEALNGVGSAVEWLGQEGFPPLKVLPNDQDDTDRISMSGWDFEDTSSSQFISGLLMASPFLAQTLEITMPSRPTSESYVHMTLAVAGQAGLHMRMSDDGHRLRVSMLPQRLSAFSLDIEPDASGATYFLGAAALIQGSRCVIDGLPPVTGSKPLQGDAMFCDLIQRMNADRSRNECASNPARVPWLGPVEYDLCDMPDTAMTAAVLACFASPTADNPTATSTLRGLRTLRVKETDRLEALRVELTKFGASVEIFQDGDDEGLRITPPVHALAGKPPVSPDAPEASEAPIYFDTYHDHRMAMSLALIGLRRPNVFIRGPKCVAKTYPTFWRDLAKLYS